MKIRVRHLEDGDVLLEPVGSPVRLTAAEAHQLAEDLRGEVAPCPRCGRRSREALVALSCGACGAAWSDEGAVQPPPAAVRADVCTDGGAP